VASLDLIDQLAKFLRELAMTTPRRLRRDLQGDRVEARIVPLGMAPDQSFDLVGRCHWEVSTWHYSATWH
jgi:hypothetical protein